ncbi:WD40-repeat-containing domain protein, partial [Chytriomyces sp. MP71]
DLRQKAQSPTTFEGRADKVRDVQFSPTSSYDFIAAFENGEVQKWDIRKPSEPERRWNAHFGLALTIDWHPDGTVFASAGRDRVIKVWDTKADPAPMYSIQTIGHVARIAWRPRSQLGESAYQIASCSLQADSKVSVWDLGRGFVAEWAVEEHDAPVTDFLWHDSNVLWTVSKDHTFVRQTLEVAGYRPASLLSSCAMSWNALGDITFSVPSYPITDSTDDMRHGDLGDITISHPGPPPQTSGVAETELFHHTAFQVLAHGYDGTCEEIWDVCFSNSEAAADLDLPRASQTWRFLQLLFGIESQQTDPPTLGVRHSAPNAPTLTSALSMAGTTTTTVVPGIIPAAPVPEVLLAPAGEAYDGLPKTWMLEGLAIPQLDREDIVHELLRFYGELGNAQMCATICLVLEGYVTISSDMKELWFSSYVDLLLRFGTFNVAARVMALSNIPSVSARNQESTTIHSACGFCSKPIPNAPQPGWICERCKRFTTICSYCRKPVKGTFSWCHGCQHGGHLNCLERWFAKNSECPSGCGHLCK